MYLRREEKKQVWVKEAIYSINGKKTSFESGKPVHGPAEDSPARGSELGGFAGASGLRHKA